MNETCLCEELDLNQANPFLLCVADTCAVKDTLSTKEHHKFTLSGSHECRSQELHSYDMRTPRSSALEQHFCCISGSFWDLDNILLYTNAHPDH